MSCPMSSRTRFRATNSRNSPCATASKRAAPILQSGCGAPEASCVASPTDWQDRLAKHNGAQGLLSLRDPGSRTWATRLETLSLLATTLNLRAQAVEFLVEPFVSAVEMFGISDDGFSFGGQGGDDQGGRAAKIGCLDRRAG